MLLSTRTRGLINPWVVGSSPTAPLELRVPPAPRAQPTPPAPGEGNCCRVCYLVLGRRLQAFGLIENSMFGVHSLWAALAARVACGSVPARRNDPYRVALAVEGGGSRAAFCSGMALAVERGGLLLCFDDVYALSSGALTAASLLSGRASIATELWADPRVLELAIDPTRLLRGRPVFDTEYLTNVAGGVGWRAVLDSPVRFHPLATDAATGAVVDLHPFLTTEADLRTALRATLGLPLVSGPAVSMGGRRLFDGGLAEAMPVHTPARQGVTHILFLRTRRADQPRRSHPGANGSSSAATWPCAAGAPSGRGPPGTGAGSRTSACSPRCATRRRVRARGADPPPDRLPVRAAYLARSGAACRGGRDRTGRSTRRDHSGAG
jgi:predicted patatin/cPLA2 family phospholipase